MSQFPSQFTNPDAELLNNSIRRLTAEVENVELRLTRKRISLARIAVGVCLGHMLFAVLSAVVGFALLSGMLASMAGLARRYYEDKAAERLAQQQAQPQPATVPVFPPPPTPATAPPANQPPPAPTK